MAILKLISLVYNILYSSLSWFPKKFGLKHMYGFKINRQSWWESKTLGKQTVDDHHDSPADSPQEETPLTIEEAYKEHTQ